MLMRRKRSEDGGLCRGNPVAVNIRRGVSAVHASTDLIRQPPRHDPLTCATPTTHSPDAVEYARCGSIAARSLAVGARLEHKEVRLRAAPRLRLRSCTYHRTAARSYETHRRA
jgi:hypothetical protein